MPPISTTLPVTDESASPKLAIGERVLADRLQLLFDQSFPAVFISVVVSLLVASVLWIPGNEHRVLTWFGLLTATSVLRLVLFLAWRRTRPTASAALSWERPYLATLMLSSFAWGLGAVWITPADSPVHQAIVFFFLVGMAGGALSVYSAMRLAAMATIAVLLLPTVAWHIVRGGPMSLVMGIGALIFFFSALRATRVLSNALQENIAKTYALREAKEAAEHMASTDALTGLVNRRSFFDQASVLFHYCRRRGLPVAAIVLDLDHFKRVNDTRGHAVGDLALRHVGELIRSSVRRSDLCCRWGGEEFVVMLPDTPLDDALMVGEKLRLAIATRPVTVPSGDFSVTASVGVAEGLRDLESLIDRADAAMYAAKREGRNLVRVSEALPD